MFLQDILSYRLDFVSCALLLLVFAWYSRRALRKRSKDCQPCRRILFILLLVLIIGGFATEWAARARMDNLARIFSDFSPMFAWKVKSWQREKISHVTSSNQGELSQQKDLLAQRAAWLESNPLIADIYVIEPTAERKGLRYYLPPALQFDGEQEPPAKNEAIKKAMAGQKVVFHSTIQKKHGNLYITAYSPINNAAGETYAVLGVDFFAMHWITTIFSARLTILICTLTIAIVALGGFVLISLNRLEIIERKRAETLLLQAKEAADESNRAKSEFLAVMSHEIRTPLTAIMGFANVLAESKLDENQRRHAQTIVSASERLSSLLNDVLDFSKIEDRKIVLNTVTYMPAKLGQEVVDLFAIQSRQKGISISFETNFPSELKVDGDPSRIRQILINFISNAVKFTEAGEVKLRIEFEPPQRNSYVGKLHFSVVDSGIGIEPEKIKRLFQLYTQVHSNPGLRYSGTGLGLAISKRLVELMGGTIGAKSTFGLGSQFFFQIPSAVVAIKDAATQAAHSSQADEEKAPVKRRALIVDDQPLNRELLKLILRRHGYESDLATNGVEATQLAAAQIYDVIFMDLQMPGIDGFETTRRIRSSEKEGQRMLIIAVSAMTQKGTHELCLKSGLDDYITKPVYIPALRSVLAAHGQAVLQPT